MKILLLTDGIYPFVVGGMQKHSYYLAKYLNKRNHNVQVIHCVYKGEMQEGELDQPEYTAFKRDLIRFRAYRFPDGGKLPGHYIRANKTYSTQLYNDLKDQLNEFDLIYAQGFTGWEFIRQKQKGAHSVPVFINIHGYEMFQRPPSFKVGLQLKLMKGISRDLSRGADFVFSFGGQITEILLKEGVREDQILECSIGIEKDWLRPEIRRTDPALRRFAFIGRYERRKGIEELTQLLRQVIQEEAPPFEFHFIGPIPEEFRISDERMIYHGEIRDAEKIKSILPECDILTVPSYSEGMPTVIMEAMAMGLAILGTDVGAISQQIQDNGWLVKAPEIDLLKTAFMEALKLPPATLDSYKNKSLEKVKTEYLWDLVIDRKLELIGTALKQSSLSL